MTAPGPSIIQRFASISERLVAMMNLGGVSTILTSKRIQKYARVFVSDESIFVAEGDLWLNMS
jgi:hypothetical protein